MHPASFVEAQMHFGNEIRPGSTFRNGQVTLELVGVSTVEKAVCAMVEYDAGESSLRMIIDLGLGHADHRPQPSGIRHGGRQRHRPGWHIVAKQRRSVHLPVSATSMLEGGQGAA